MDGPDWRWCRQDLPPWQAAGEHADLRVLQRRASGFPGQLADPRPGATDVSQMTAGVMTMDDAYRNANRVLGTVALAATLLLGGCASPGPSGNVADAGKSGTVASEVSAANV